MHFVKSVNGDISLTKVVIMRDTPFVRHAAERG